MLQNFLSFLGLSAKEIDIYLCLVRLGYSSATQVSKTLERKRTSTYKLMTSMYHKGFLTMSGSGAHRMFAAIELDVLEKQFHLQASNVIYMQDNFQEIQTSYQSLQGPSVHKPTVELSEGILGIQKAHHSILAYIHTHHLITTTCIASKTFESLAVQNKEVLREQTRFLETLEKKHIYIQGHYAQGMSLMESLISSSNYRDALELPTSNDAIQVWITGDLVTTFIMKKNPQIIQIMSHELAMMWMFLAEKLEK